MAMLAAPRRKQKVINLRAKNNDWSNDTNKFGQRMLEKMGWSSGKGLGAKENGTVEHVVARYKNDDKGLGFEDKNDQWTKHEDDFNALLANLSNAEEPKEKLHSGVSLEVKSKKSKARVHYHKFTRGKDLTRYSEKELANIFGKKSLKEEKKSEGPLQDDINTTEQVFTEKGSMEDYFKSKLLAKFKSKTNLLSPKPESDDNAEYSFKGFSTNADESDEKDNQTHQGDGFSFYNSTNNDTAEKENDNTDLHEVVDPATDADSQKLKKKKKKKNKNKDNELAEINYETEPTLENPEQDVDIPDVPKSDKKSKKKKKVIEEPVEIDPAQEIKPKKKKSKASKNDAESKQEAVQETQEVEEENYVPKKKKKRKNKEINE